MPFNAKYSDPSISMKIRSKGSFISDIRGSAGQLLQVVMNLVQNAYDAAATRDAIASTGELASSRIVAAAFEDAIARRGRQAERLGSVRRYAVFRIAGRP